MASGTHTRGTRSHGDSTLCSGIFEDALVRYSTVTLLLEVLYHVLVRHSVHCHWQSKVVRL
jgi:hypothetical protein